MVQFTYSNLRVLGYETGRKKLNSMISSIIEFNLLLISSGVLQFLPPPSGASVFVQNNSVKLKYQRSKSFKCCSLLSIDYRI